MIWFWQGSGVVSVFRRKVTGTDGMVFVVMVDFTARAGGIRIPAGKDSKVGNFSGTVGAFDPVISGRMADVWWNSSAEGMQVTEELMIEFGEGSAVALFGEMIAEGENYVYKDKSTLTPGFLLSQVDCEDLTERLALEGYVRANISTLSTLAPVLGGSWYVTEVKIDAFSDSGIVSYEDGHIAVEASFRYTFDPATSTPTIKDFNVVE